MLDGGMLKDAENVIQYRCGYFAVTAFLMD